MKKLLNIPSKYWFSVFTLLLMLITTSVFAGGTIKGITVLEGEEFEVGEQFSVQYILRSNGSKLNGKLRLSGTDFGELELIGSGNSQSTSFGSNGMQDNLTYQYYLKANKSGKFKLPAITFILDGKSYKTQEKTVRIVTPSTIASVNGDLILSLKPDKNSVYVGETIKYDLHWYSAYQVQDVRLKEIPKFDGFIIKTIQSKTQKKIRTINGKKYLTNKDYTFILTPIKAGKLKIPVVKSDAYLQAGRGFFSNTEVREISTKPSFLTVKPLPKAPSNIEDPVLIGEFKIKTIIDKPTLNINDAVTIKIKVFGKGNLNSLNDLQIKYPSAFEALPTTSKENITTDENGIKGVKTFEFIAIPRQPGSFTIDPISISTFNPRTKKFKVIYSDEIKVEVTGKADPSRNQSFSSNGSSDVELQGKDIRYLQTISSLSSKKKNQFTGSFMHYFLSISGLTGFLFGTLFFKVRSKSTDEVKSIKKGKANKIAKKYLKDAQKELNGDKAKFYELVDEAINNYLLGKLMIEQSQLNKNKLTKMLSELNVPETLISETHKISSDCKMARFSPISLEPKDMYNKATSIINALENQLK